MSGGHLDYFYDDLRDHVGDFDDKELDDLVRDLSDLFKAREWFLSSDTSEGSWNEARDNFKAKWFKEGARKERIVKYLDEIKAEVLHSLGVSDDYCMNCSHWTQDGEAYGDCDINPHMSMHKKEHCGRFERK